MISRRQFLGSSAALAAASFTGMGTSRANVARKARRLVTVFVQGGWDIAYSIDPKPELVATPEFDEVTAFENIPILTHSSRPNIGGFFQEYAPVSAVVHGINVRSISHKVCRRKLFTGVASGAGPDAGAIVANAHARDYPMPYFVVGSMAFTGPLSVISGRVGPQGQINALIDPQDAVPRMPDSPYFHEGFDASSSEEAAMRAFLDARTQRERATRGQWGSNRARIDDFVESMDKGELIRDNAQYFGESGTELGLSDQVELALTALERDLAWSVGITADLGFDTHIGNAQQGPRQDALFNGLRSLATALVERDLFEDTVVVVHSEMSRTPAINGEDGKDHHPVTSALVFGGGIAGGEVYGANGDDVEALPVDFETGSTSGPNTRSLDPDSWVTGIAALAGADASDYLGADPFSAFIG